MEYIRGNWKILDLSSFMQVLTYRFSNMVESKQAPACPLKTHLHLLAQKIQRPHERYLMKKLARPFECSARLVCYDAELAMQLSQYFSPITSLEELRCKMTFLQVARFRIFLHFLVSATTSADISVRAP